MPVNTAIAVPTASVAALAPNANRATFTIYNPSANATIWIGLGAAATASPPSIPVPPQSSVTEAYQGSVTLIASAATDVTVVER